MTRALTSFARRLSGFSATGTTTSASRIQRWQHQSLDKLELITEPVVTIDLLHAKQDETFVMPYKQTEPDRIGLHDWIDEYDKYLAEMSKRIATIKPWQKGNSVLIGDEAAHGYDRIIISEHANGFDAVNTIFESEVPLGPLTRRRFGVGSVTLAGVRAATFASLPTFESRASAAELADRKHARGWSDCPFANEASAIKSSWEALETQPTDHMLAFNLIRTPDPAGYKAYSSHFAPLPERYGMRFVEAAMLDGPSSIMICDGEPDAPDVYTTSGLDALEPPFPLQFNLMALVYFPSSRAFVDAWSDPELCSDAYPMREELLKDGFAHVWARCEDVEK